MQSAVWLLSVNDGANQSRVESPVDGVLFRYELRAAARVRESARAPGYDRLSRSNPRGGIQESVLYHESELLAVVREHPSESAAPIGRRDKAHAGRARNVPL